MVGHLLPCENKTSNAQRGGKGGGKWGGEGMSRPGIDSH